MTGLIPLIIYVVIFVAAYFIVTTVVRRAARTDYTSLKTVTFGDESAVRADRWASVISVLTIFLIWAMFTGSTLIPGFLHMPGPFSGDTSFTYTLETADGARADAEVQIRVHPLDQKPEPIAVAESDGLAQADSVLVGIYRNAVIAWDRNDGVTRRDDGARIAAINGQAAGPGDRIDVGNGTVAVTDKGSLNFTPYKGWQMEKIWLPSPEGVWTRFVSLISDGYQNFTLGFRLAMRWACRTGSGVGLTRL